MIWLLTRVMISSTTCPAERAGRQSKGIRAKQSFFIRCFGPPRFLGLLVKRKLRPTKYFTPSGARVVARSSCRQVQEPLTAEHARTPAEAAEKFRFCQYLIIGRLGGRESWPQWLTFSALFSKLFLLGPERFGRCMRG